MPLAPRSCKVFRPHDLGTRVLAPHNFGVDARSSPQSPSPIPALGAASRGRARRDRGGSSPSAGPEGSRPSAPFPTDPNMASAAAARANTSPRHGQPGPAGAGARKVSLLPPQPAAARCVPTPTAPTRPGAGGGAEGATPPLRRRLPARTLPAPPAPASQGAWGPARPARSGRGGRSRSQVTSPLLQSNPTTAARAGFTPARAPARPRPSAKHGHEHTRPALSSRFPRPAHRLALPLHPHATARGAGPSAEATPTGGPLSRPSCGTLLCTEVVRPGGGNPGSPDLTFLTRAG